LFIYNLNSNNDDDINITNSYFIRYHHHHHYRHQHPSRDRPFQKFSASFNSPFKGLPNRLLVFGLHFSIIFGPSFILAQILDFAFHTGRKVSFLLIIWMLQ